MDEAPERFAAEARALLDAWLRAQNGGDFDAYAKLYAERFTGVKRVDARARRFDRAGWLADRKSMFERSFSVRAEDVHVSATSAAAAIDFEQAWSSASFKDVGRKVLVLAREGDTWRIASEEMKSSSTGAARGQGEVPKEREFSFVVEAPEPLLLLAAPVDTNAVHGPLRYLDDTRARRDVLTKALPENLRGLVGERFALYGPEGEVCRGEVTGFDVLVHAQPHFGMQQGWQGAEGKVATPEERAVELWRLTERNGRFLVAKLQTEGPCSGARWARAENLPKPTVWRRRDPGPEESNALLQAARASRVHKELQAQFQAAFSKTTHWDATGVAPRMAVFEDGTGQVFASLSVASGEDDSCASPFDAEAWFLFQKRGTAWSLVSAPPDGHVDSAWPRFLNPLHTELAFDLDGDGRPEFLGGNDLFRESGGNYRAVLNLSPAYFDCPC